MCIRCSINYIESGCSTCMYMYMYMCVCVSVCVCVCLYRLFHQLTAHIAIELDVLQPHEQRSIVLKYHKWKPWKLCIQIPTTHTVFTSVSVNIAAHTANLAASV